MTPAAPLAPLYFLVEETSRELNSRVLLGTAGARVGFSSHIIPQWFAWEHINALPPGIVVFKGNNSEQSSRMAAAREAGHRVAAIEEEILGVTKDDVIQCHFQSTNADECELFLVQGNHVRDILASHRPDWTERIAVTGNPRTDLLRPPFDGPLRDEAAAFRRAHGDYILVNTNFGGVNPRIEDTIAFRDLNIRVGLLDPNSQNDRDEFVERCRWERGNMALLAEVIAACEASPSLPRIIIRPHPAENIQKWRAAYAEHERVSIIREGDHMPWTAGARLLLHTGCTTGVEAMLLETPVLCLRGGTSSWHSHLTSNHVNPIAPSLETAMAAITAVFAGDDTACSPTRAMWEELERQLLPKGTNTAAEGIIDALAAMSPPPGYDNPRDPDKAIARLASKPLVASGHKIDTLDFNANSVRANARRFADYLGHHQPPSVTKLGEAMIRLSPDTGP
jgi:surface carbohydrate biosynthesis protein